MRLDGRIALVTGASAGIGTAVAEQLAAAGARVIVHGRDQQRTEAVAQRIGGVAVLGDLAAPGAADQLAEAALTLTAVSTSWWQMPARGGPDRSRRCLQPRSIA